MGQVGIDQEQASLSGLFRRKWLTQTCSPSSLPSVEMCIIHVVVCGREDYAVWALFKCTAMVAKGEGIGGG
jgi:hypothetical protein